MYDDERSKRRFYAVSMHEDVGPVSFGSLIPKTQKKRSATKPAPTTSTYKKHLKPVLTITAPIALFLIALGVMSFDFVSGNNSVAAPIVVVENMTNGELTPLHYGVEMSLAQPDFFQTTHQSFIDNSLTFIEADLTTMEVAYYQEGNEVFRAPILAKGREGSWWETPAGLYEISYKAENHFSSFGQVYQPYSMAFQGNFFIHGWPYHPDGEPVAPGFSGGCIRLADVDAATLFEIVEPGTPVLVHEADFKGDGFLYESKVPEIDTPHYLVADIKNNTVLATSDVTGEAPVASLTKLMTALIAAEYINLDKDVWITQEAYVDSLVPRLSGRSRVSMYSLLQLLLVESSNEAAEVIAAELGRERFIALMNEKAAALGLSNTEFVDPSGVGAGNTASLEDLLRLTQYIYHNRSFILELTANQDLPTAYKSGEFGTLVNFNRFDDIENFIGGKVGETQAARQTSISLHEVEVNGDLRIIAIILLGSDNRTEDVKTLLEFIERRFGD